VPATRPQAGIRRSSTNGQPFAGTTGRPQFLPNTMDWLGRWRLAANASNDYLIDCEVQHTQSYTGIDDIHLQDQAITESMGATVDRTQEHLGTSDVMNIRTRRRLMKAAIDLQQGIIPPTVDHPELYRQRSGGVILPRSADWVEATEELRAAFVRRPEPVLLGQSSRVTLMVIGQSWPEATRSHIGPQKRSAPSRQEVSWHIR
jgi:hypothetical protein